LKKLTMTLTGALLVLGMTAMSAGALTQAPAKHAACRGGGNIRAAKQGCGSVSDIRLKRDIVLVGRLDNGLGLYRYRYLWSDVVYVGVMAQEVAMIRPDAIVRDGIDDYLRVDYSRLGLKLMTLPK
jgi:hypothetical protein